MQHPGTALLLPVAMAVALHWPVSGRTADAGAGRLSAAACAECHDAKDWDGESQSSLQALIGDVVRGAVKHTRKISLSDVEIANIAAYWAETSNR